MPHKRNPVLSERICGLSRVIRGYISSALENIPLWHERDISHSSVERVIFPDATSLTDYILNLLIGIVRDLRVNEERIRENMMMNYRIYYSQNVLLALTEKGVLRDVAYVWIQEDAFKAMEQKRDFMEIVLEDSRIREYLSREEIERCFSPEIFLKNIDVIFERSGIYDS